jgi:hypothetical protein
MDGCGEKMIHNFWFSNLSLKQSISMLYENMDQAAIFVYPVERENTTVVYLKTKHPQ